ncbi:nuclear transport factor 2 family protein [Aureitalea sp. L0-47]|uniref:nuclear transport factor 2 family protein n=1 Tax=Aureitalea sp. L0-47 TaxID=2816962 RepID=UPI002237A8B7|nr:nuclear transport factor 2 family protein [Aureitalea sp. L0-47]MCW5519806.1 nuclear transport factor 2 family protein [Aureitalea sp. L0-47]
MSIVPWVSLFTIMMKAILIFACFISFGMMAQVSTDSELFLTLKQNDSLIFERGFNNCELNAFEDLLSEDLEFYHDKGGITKSKEEFVQQYKNGICGNPNFSSRRELIEGSLEVFPLYDGGKLYGALQKGIHRFFEKPKEKQEIPGSTARFTHLWLIEDDQWRLKRVLSYDHQMK